MKSIKNSISVFLGAFLCCFLWGSAFPAIKLGYRLWHIESGETFRIIRFAGIRFFLAGVMVILIATVMRKKPVFPAKSELKSIMFLSLFQTIGQYIFFYIGLAHTTGVNSAVVDSLTTFFAIIIAGLFMRMETLTARKIFGCLLGFTGILLINLTPSGFSLRPLGDGLVALSALCYGISSSLIKKYSTGHDTVLFSGYQFMFGGAVMTISAHLVLLLKGSSSLPSPSVDLPKALAMLLYLALVSSVAYTLWGILLRQNDVSKISIFGFMNPVIGVLLSALLLGEMSQLGIRYLIALLLIGSGIAAVNITQKND